MSTCTSPWDRKYIGQTSRTHPTAWHKGGIPIKPEAGVRLSNYTVVCGIIKCFHMQPVISAAGVGKAGFLTPHYTDAETKAPHSKGHESLYLGGSKAPPQHHSHLQGKAGSPTVQRAGSKVVRFSTCTEKLLEKKVSAKLRAVQHADTDQRSLIISGHPRVMKFKCKGKLG